MGEFFAKLGIIRDITPLEPETIFSIAGFPIANTTITIWLITLIFIVLALVVAGTFKLRPTKFQVFIEMIYEQVVGLVDQITNDRYHSKKIFPIIGAIFVYLVVANLISIIPGLTEITLNGAPIFRSPTADFNTTFGLALGAVIAINIVSIRDWGLLGHLGKFFRFREVYQGFRQGMASGFTALIDFFVGLLDIIGEIAKVVSLALRLFGNMYAGQVLMIIIFGALAFVIPSIWLAMNIFVGILQAMVFSALVAAYYMLAIKPTSDVASREDGGKKTEVAFDAIQEA
ncbi:MAG: F0F1 ATP synthase subunit A [Candidatus Nomurabacteria bacterium]|nr:F0F1 ATP synthase subunit A [Candidatus Nomurabacteria bacterium]